MPSSTPPDDQTTPALAPTEAAPSGESEREDAEPVGPPEAPDGAAEGVGRLARRLWPVIARGAAVAGRATAKAAVLAGAAVADGYRAIDPDLRRHVAHAPLVGLTQLVPAREDFERHDDDGQNVVVFVHGLAGHPGNFAPMRAWFKFMGRTRTYAVSNAGYARIPDMAQHLIEAVDRIVEVNGLLPSERIDIVAHSMGGLVTRVALEDPRFAARVANVVTLGTPHSGTYAARLGATQQVLDLRPDSAVLEQLAEQVPWGESRPRLFALWSPADMLLHPPESGKLDGAINIAMPGFTHLSYLLHPRAFGRVWDALREPVIRAS